MQHWRRQKWPVGCEIVESKNLRHPITSLYSIIHITYSPSPCSHYILVANSPTDKLTSLRIPHILILHKTATDLSPFAYLHVMLLYLTSQGLSTPKYWSLTSSRIPTMIHSIIYTIELNENPALTSSCPDSSPAPSGNRTSIFVSDTTRRP